VLELEDNSDSKSEARKGVGVRIPSPAPTVEERVEDAQVRERVREMLSGGRLPSAEPVKLWAGPSMGKPCSVCGESIRTSTEYELDFTPPLTLLLHPHCYAIWNEERGRGPSVSAEDAS
jgi:hypothetical protein